MTPSQRPRILLVQPRPLNPRHTSSLCQLRRNKLPPRQVRADNFLVKLLHRDLFNKLQLPNLQPRGAHCIPSSSGHHKLPQINL